MYNFRELRKDSQNYEQKLESLANYGGVIIIIIYFQINNYKTAGGS